ncbi:MAG TPA: GerMN domain-containing protein, partial [Ferruginibacter sp.]|nr:GerMN domain-containing protein [Ferruginibacter sp.]
MKKILCLIWIASFMACNTKEKDQATIKEQEPETDSVVVEETKLTFNPESKLYVWKSSPDYTKTKNPEFSNTLLNADSLIKGLNELNENVLLEKTKISGDTIYTEIKNSQFLTESMGSTGAEMYVADVVLNLTEVPGIKYVNIQLVEGSHMQ